MKCFFTIAIAFLFCHSNITAQSTDLLPLTGAMVKGTGIRYKAIEIRLNEEVMVSSDLPRKEKMTVKLTEPWSLVTDAKGNVYPGAGFRILDMKRKVLAEQKNIFKKDQPGIPRDYLKSLSVSVVLTDDIKSLDSVIVQAKFFDTKDNDDSVVVEMHCRVVPMGKGNTTTDWGSFSGTFIAKGAYAGLDPGRVKGVKLKAKTDALVKTDTAFFTIEKLDGLVAKNGKMYFDSKYILYNNQFKVLEQKQNIIEGSNNGIDSIGLKNIKLRYLLPPALASGFARVCITDANSTAKLDIVLPVIRY